jgi:hypothetical protein
MEIREILNQRNIHPTLRLVSLRILSAADQLRDTVINLRGRVVALEEDAVKVMVVDSVADLPEHAAPTDVFRVRTGTVAERTAWYVGNGPSAPLTKLTPTAL